jgi:F0F1-type ATP synthase membrane subunit b/b'
MTSPSPQQPSLTSLPRLEDLPTTPDGAFEADGVRAAFEGFRRHALQLQAQLRVLQAAGKTSNVDPTGHAVRMDALHLIRAAAEFADALERDAQNASASQFERTEAEVTRRQRDLQEKERQVERYREESERQRNEIVNAAKSESRELLANANRDATAALNEAEARGARLLEQSRHQATELTNAVRAEVEQTLEWARAQAGAILARAQQGAEQLLTAAGLGPEALNEVSEAILTAARASTEASRGRSGNAPAALVAEPPRIASAPALEPDAEPDAAPDASPVVEEAADEGQSDGGAADDAPAGDATPPVSAPTISSPPASSAPAPSESPLSGPPTSPAPEQGEDAS